MHASGKSHCYELVLTVTDVIMVDLGGKED